jgi:immune inhibitor A
VPLVLVLSITLTAILPGDARKVPPVATAQSESLPTRDPVSLAGRFLGVTRPNVALAAFTPSVGDRRSFFVLNQANSTYQAVEAVLVQTSAHAHWWVQEGVTLDPGALERSAALFESASLGALQMVFGELRLPANASDQRANVLNARTQGVGAYFSSVDATPKSVHPYSNEIALIVVNVDSFRPGSASYNETLAHEMQHMLHWTSSPASETWFDEGVSEVVASAVRGVPSRGASYARRPDRPLIAWTSEPGAFAGQYDGSYLFAQYLADRFGMDALGRIIRLGRPPGSLESLVSDLGQRERFDEMFGDWLVANLKDDQRIERPPRYRYAQADPDVSITAWLEPGSDWADSVSQFGVDYLELAPGTSALEIQGAEKVKIAPASGDDGDLVWWGNRADSLDATLTRQVDLRDGSAALLEFRMWFNTERDFDHGYVAVSADGGLSWRALDGLNTDSQNPTGNAYGPSFTGLSGGPSEARWVDERIDLSPYAGQEVLVRFEYITDQGTTHQGWIVDDIALNEAGVSKDSETDQAGWQAAGFVRTSLGLPSRMMVQVISGSGSGTTVDRYWIDGGVSTVISLANQSGTRTVVTVSGVTPLTVEPMAYQVRALP